MTMQTDVKSSFLAATGTFQNEAATANLQRTRVKGAYIGGGGLVTFRDGGASGIVRMVIDNAAHNTVVIPGEGILFTDDIHVTMTGTVNAVTIFYG